MKMTFLSSVERLRLKTISNPFEYFMSFVSIIQLFMANKIEKKKCLYYELTAKAKIYTLYKVRFKSHMFHDLQHTS